MRNATSIKKYMLYTALVLVSGHVKADWTVLEKNNNATDYVDTANIRRSGNTVQMWDLSDFATPQSAGGYVFSSMLTLMEYDCTAKRSRKLQLTVFSGNMQKGKVEGNVTLGDKAEWSYVLPNSRGESMLAVACK